MYWMRFFSPCRNISGYAMITSFQINLHFIIRGFVIWILSMPQTTHKRKTRKDRGYGLDDPGIWFRYPARVRHSCLHRRDRFWDQPIFLCNKYRNLFPREVNGRSVKLTKHLQLILMLKCNELCCRSSVRLHGMRDNFAFNFMLKIFNAYIRANEQIYMPNFLPA
jgi:hypothetical protein